jgi:hypothetical protein
MNLLDGLSFPQLLWGMPVLLAVHNLEEAPRMAKWSGELPVRLLSYTTRQFMAAAALLTLAVFALTGLGMHAFRQPDGFQLILGMQMAMLFNACVPHLAATIAFRKYSPGVVTGLLLEIPFSLYLLRRAAEAGFLPGQSAWNWPLLGALTMLALAWLTLQLGRRITS